MVNWWFGAWWFGFVGEFHSGRNVEIHTKWFNSWPFHPQLEITYPLKGSLKHPKKATKNCQEKFVLRKKIDADFWERSSKTSVRNHVVALQVNFWCLPWKIIFLHAGWKGHLCLITHLVGVFNPIEKYMSQIRSFPQGSGWTFKNNIRNHHPVMVLKKSWAFQQKTSKLRSKSFQEKTPENLMWNPKKWVP